MLPKWNECTHPSFTVWYALKYRSVYSFSIQYIKQYHSVLCILIYIKYVMIERDSFYKIHLGLLNGFPGVQLVLSHIKQHYLI
jgi:hypothetical protein